MFEDAHPLEILRWAGDTYGDELVVTASFGDAVLVHLVSRADPRRRRASCSTPGTCSPRRSGSPSTCASATTLNLRTIHPRPDAERDVWQTDTDACCAVRKVEPMQRALHGKRAWVSGLRRADSPARATTPIVHDDLLRNVTKVNPIATWTDEDVEHYKAIELLPEHPLTDRGYTSIGCWPCTRPVEDGADPRSGRWSGSDKYECGLHLPVAGT